ncbi:MAG: apolipoprotein N-acyltransferase, partial [Myxococcota bacterium]
MVQAAAAGVMYALGHVGFGIWPLLFVCLVPFWAVLDPCRTSTLRRALWLGLVFGAAVYVAGYGWLWWLVDGFLAGQRLFGVFLWLLYGVWVAAGFAVHAAITWGLWRRSGRLWGAAVSSLVLVQWLQPHLFWAEMGVGLIHAPVLAQTAELGGPLLLTGWVASINAVVLHVMDPRCTSNNQPAKVRAGHRVLQGPVVLVAFFSLAAVMFGVQRLNENTADRTSADDRLKVGAVQANLSPSVDAAERIQAHRQYVAMSRTLTAQGADLIVWPESAYGPALRLPLPIAGHSIRSDISVPLLFGGTSVEPDEQGQRLGNSVFLVEKDGMIRQVYRKRLLIPWAEFVPLSTVWPALRRMFPHAQRFSTSKEAEAFEVPGWRIATPICYEIVHASYVRRLMRKIDPHVIVTVANDAWFGDSQEPWIHLAVARLRAIEHRRWIVRATNSGISALIDPRGLIEKQTPLSKASVLFGIVH